MNRLWIRIKSIRQFKKVEREKQRMDLKVTVGENIVRLSRFEGVNLETYQATVLPALIKLVGLSLSAHFSRSGRPRTTCPSSTSWTASFLPSLTSTTSTL